MKTDDKLEMMILNVIWSSAISVLFFIATAGLLHYVDGINLATTEADLGLLVMITYCVITFGGTHLIIIEE